MAIRTASDLYDAVEQAVSPSTGAWLRQHRDRVMPAFRRAARRIPRRKDLRYTMTDVFAGGGLLALAGFIEGYSLQELVECDAAAAKTLAAQLPGTVVCGDATRWTPDVPIGGLDVLTGGPPCQGWSTAGRQLGPSDERNLFPEVIRWAREAQPRVIVMENSPNTVRAGKWKAYWDVWWRTLAEEAGYEGTAWVLKAADYGTPQTRERAFYVLWPKGAPWGRFLRSGPPPTRVDPRGVGRGSPGVYTRAFDRLNDGCCGGFGLSSCVNIGNLEGACSRCRDGSNYGEAPNDNPRDLLSPEAIAYLNRQLVDGRNRLKVQGFIDYGGAFAGWWPTGKRDALVGPWLAPAMTRSMYKGVPYGVTVEPGVLPEGRGGALHPKLLEVRQLTPREAAKLQDVPSWYVFSGGDAEAYKQVGNGIPVNMGRAVLAHVRDALSRADGLPVGPPPGSMAAGGDEGLFPLADRSICRNVAGSGGMGGSRTELGPADPNASLWERYGVKAARAAEKGQRPQGLPEGLPEKAVHMFDVAERYMLEPEMRWAVAAADGEARDEDSAEALGVIMAEMGLSSANRRDLTVFSYVVDLALETHPERWDGRGFGERTYRYAGGNRVALRSTIDQRLRDPGPMPRWLALAILTDALTREALGKAPKVQLVAIDRDTAAEFLRQHHSQLPNLPRRQLYALGALRGDRLVAIALAGHPSAPWKRVPQENVLELSRVATDGTVPGVSSMLAAALLKLAPSSKRGPPDAPWLFVTYSLASEGAHTYKALADLGLRPTALLRGKPGKHGKRSAASVEAAKGGEAKIRWEAGPAADPPRWDLLA